MDTSPKLSPKRRRFVEEYLVDSNGAQAAIRAGYAPRSANVTGAQLLANPNVRAYIDAAQAERARRLGYDADRVTREYLAIAFAKVLDLFEQGEDGTLRLKTPEEWPQSLRQAIAGIKVKRRVEQHGQERVPVEIVDIKLVPKIPALNQLSKMLRLIPEE